MKQFDIVRLTDKQMCVVIQHDLLRDRRTRVVVPLFLKSTVVSTPRLHLGLDTWAFNSAARDFFRSYGLEPYNERLWMSVS